MAANRLVCLSEEQAAQLMIHCSPFGVIPKKNKPNKWRLIVDLSSPTGESVNDGISRELSSLSYTSVDVVVEHILTLGRGSMLAKMNIKQAYRMIPVRPQDRPLLGMKWQGQVFVSLEPTLSGPDFVSQLWRKILRDKIRTGKPGFKARYL